MKTIQISQEEVARVRGFFAGMNAPLTDEAIRLIIGEAKAALDIEKETDIKHLVRRILLGERIGGRNVLDKEFYKKLAKMLGMGFSEVMSAKRTIAKVMRKITRVDERGGRKSIKIGSVAEIAGEHKVSKVGDDDIRRRGDEFEKPIYERGVNWW